MLKINGYIYHRKITVGHTVRINLRIEKNRRMEIVLQPINRDELCHADPTRGYRCSRFDVEIRTGTNRDRPVEKVYTVHYNITDDLQK